MLNSHLHSAMPTENILEVPELGTPRYNGCFSMVSIIGRFHCITYYSCTQNINLVISPGNLNLYVEWGSTNTTGTSVFMMKISHILKCEGKNRMGYGDGAFMT